MTKLKYAKAIIGSCALVAGAGLAQASPHHVLGRLASPQKLFHTAKLTAATTISGYRLISANGTVYTHGGDRFFGDAHTLSLAKPIVGSAPTPDGLGYWLVASDGGIFSYGDAAFYGSTGAMRLNKPIVGMASTPDGKGYWLVASDGGIFSFGDAAFYGSTGAMTLNKPIVGMASTPDGKGYWLVASDGGIFSFGDAAFYGSTGAMTLNKPIVGMASTPDGKGYWLVASDGGIFSFGDAAFHGSTGAIKLNKPIVGMQATPTGAGYWLVASDGGIFSFGDASYYGSQGGSQLTSPIIGINTSNQTVATASGATGFDVSNFQCASTASPATGTFAIIEVNGWPFSATNPCITKEASWAGNNYQLYTFLALPISGNTSNPTWNPSTPTTDYSVGPKSTTDIASQAYNYGYNAAKYSYAAASSQGATSNIWWIDVEGATNYWSQIPSLNVAAIQGAADYLSSTGVVVGLYSGNAGMYAQITTGTTSGAGAIIAGAKGGPIPLWFYSASGSAACTATTNPSGNLNPFAGGIPWYIQSQLPNGMDVDYSC
ncbi:glycoside hydrolase family 25 domain-containing protein [Acidithrix ferrooxidans]|uniref:Uncharacterized protein n=1 Tax=Acidithrix ferrooxidans TaxID=1280514 RepID=A0A0D8HLS6_9ACTN|nr:hypothetical protein [Acidithrix ferrooxidans]KJF18853.1 hypothetical protein AXFE_02580 [Acidithrix ferrooxidans]